ncbi:MAG: membrane protease subunit HflC [Parasphingorhabdus sp.]|jgi:membrane protease subunit HflC
MGGKSFIALVLLGIVVVVGLMSVYVVDERERAIVFKFGEIVIADHKDGDPGLRFKTPFINNVKKFDARIQTSDADPQSFLTSEKKNLVVDSFVKWRISDVYLYYTRLQGSKSSARNRLSQRVNDSLRQEFGKRNVQDVISGDRVMIMDNVRRIVNDEMEGLGIEVVDVRLKRVDLDQEISATVYSRMVAERSRVAKELRAEGSEIAEKIRATADRESQVLIANANKSSEEIRGQGDAQATRIYAKTFGKDEEFYRLYRSLTAYTKTFADSSNLLVIEPNSEFFRYFNKSGAN